MTKELAVLIIHGMGSHEPWFAEPLIQELNDRLTRMGADVDRTVWTPVYWQDISAPRELAYFLAYQQAVSKHNRAYSDIHERIQKLVNSLFVEQLNSKAKPLIVMAHSVGAQIMSNYIWDMQHGGGEGLEPFEQMRTLVGMITFGCNTPLFRFPYEKVVPIRFPGSLLSPDQKKKARWLNFYDPDEVLRYPLSAINDRHKKVVSRDIPINVGGIGGDYWTDNRLTIPVARFLKSVLP